MLDGVSLEVRQGQIVAVVGGRLSGKTTLLQTVAGIERPEAGVMRLGEQELTAMSDRARRGLLGRELVWIDRAGPALNLEVCRFVGWPLAVHGRRRHAEQRALETLELVRAKECVGRRWGELSDRERVLVGLAQAFVGAPRLVLVDDLLDSLGKPATDETFALLRSLIARADPPCGVLMSASDLDSAIFADCIYSLRNGKLKPLAGAQTRGELIPFPSKGGLVSQDAGAV